MDLPLLLLLLLLGLDSDSRSVEPDPFDASGMLWQRSRELDEISEYELPAPVPCEVEAEFRSSKLGADGCGVLSTVDAIIAALIIVDEYFSKHLANLE